MGIPSLDDRFENPERVNDAAETLYELGADYGEHSFVNAAEQIEDGLSEEPTYSVTMVLNSAIGSIRDAGAALETGDRARLGGVMETLESELGGYPATGTGRHYSLDAQMRNL